MQLRVKDGTAARQRVQGGPIRSRRSGAAAEAVPHSLLPAAIISRSKGGGGRNGIAHTLRKGAVKTAQPPQGKGLGFTMSRAGGNTTGPREAALGTLGPHLHTRVAGMDTLLEEELSTAMPKEPPRSKISLGGDGKDLIGSGERITGKANNLRTTPLIAPSALQASARRERPRHHRQAIHQGPMVRHVVKKRNLRQTRGQAETGNTPRRRRAGSGTGGRRHNLKVRGKGELIVTAPIPIANQKDRTTAHREGGQHSSKPAEVRVTGRTINGGHSEIGASNGNDAVRVRSRQGETLNRGELGETTTPQKRRATRMPPTASQGRRRAGKGASPAIRRGEVSGPAKGSMVAGLLQSDDVSVAIGSKVQDGSQAGKGQRGDIEAQEREPPPVASSCDSHSAAPPRSLRRLAGPRARAVAAAARRRRGAGDDLAAARAGPAARRCCHRSRK